MQFPEYRARRMRRTENLRRLIRETRLSTDDFIYPLFVQPGQILCQQINDIRVQLGRYEQDAEERGHKLAYHRLNQNIPLFLLRLYGFISQFPQDLDRVNSDIGILMR